MYLKRLYFCTLVLIHIGSRSPYKTGVYLFTGLEHWTDIVLAFYTCCDRLNWFLLAESHLNDKHEQQNHTYQLKILLLASYPALIHSFYFPCCRKYSNRYLASKVASVLHYKINTCIKQEVHASRWLLYMFHPIWLGKHKFVIF